MERESRKQRRAKARAAEKSGTVGKQPKLYTRRRAIEIGLGAAALLVVGGTYLHTNGEEPQGNLNQLPNLLEPKPLPETTTEEILGEAARTIDDYGHIIPISIPKQAVLEKTRLFPSANLVPENERTLVCPGGDCTKFAVAGNTLIDTREILIFQDILNKKLIGEKDDLVGRSKKNEFIGLVFAHELTHWMGARYEYTDEFYNLVIKYAGATMPVLRDRSQYRKSKMMGAMPFIAKVGTGEQLHIFGELEEAEAYTISEYVHLSRDRQRYGSYERDTADLYVSQRAILKNLLLKLYPDYGTGIRALGAIRTQPGGREAFCETIGQRFGADKNNALEAGFKILVSINSGSTELFELLTRDKTN